MSRAPALPERGAPLGARRRVLFLDPYHAGSHRQFATDWARLSRHEVALLTLPGRHFKWRMRGGAVTLARRARTALEDGSLARPIDALVTTAACNAAELRALLPAPLARAPLAVYFHENQLDYPVRVEDARDVHFALTNWVSALAAEACWFNSDFNRSSFLTGVRALLQKMPDERELASLETLVARCRVVPLGITALPRPARSPGPLHLVWAARWEHDKAPELLLAALRGLSAAGVGFRLTCLGRRFRDVPPALATIEREFAAALVHFGEAETREDYARCLGAADVVISTALQEFFGVAVLEAVSAGCVPLVPERLVYPELYPPPCRYDGSPEGLVAALGALAEEKAREGTLEPRYERLGLARLVEAHDWRVRGPALDDALAELVARGRSGDSGRIGCAEGEPEAV